MKNLKVEKINRKGTMAESHFGAHELRISVPKIASHYYHFYLKIKVKRMTRTKLNY